MKKKKKTKREILQAMATPARATTLRRPKRRGRGEAKREVLQAMLARKTARVADLATPKNARATTLALARLRRAGLVKRVDGRTGPGFPAQYSLTPAGRKALAQLEV